MKVFAVIDTNVIVPALLSRNGETPVVKVFQALEVALSRPGSFLVTGNLKHFLTCNYSGAPILTIN